MSGSTIQADGPVQQCSLQDQVSFQTKDDDGTTECGLGLYLGIISLEEVAVQHELSMHGSCRNQYNQKVSHVYIQLQIPGQKTVQGETQHNADVCADVKQKVL